MMDLENQMRMYQTILTESGKAALKESIAAFREKYGKEWLKEFTTDYPDLAEVVSLIANFNAESAYLRLQQIVETKIDSYFAKLPQPKGILESGLRQGQLDAAKGYAAEFINSNTPQILDFHEEIQSEIHKKRF